jgi:hypothetical protein
MKFLLDQDVYVLTERFLREQGSGVIYMRMLPSAMKEVHAELKKVLETYSETELAKSFVVVEKNRHRIRRIE